MTTDDQEEKPSSKTQCFTWFHKNIISVLACIFVIAIVSLLVLVSILTWAYIRHYQNDRDLEQLREPTIQQQLFITTASVRKQQHKRKKNSTMKIHIVDDSDEPHIRSSIPISVKNGLQLFVVHAGLLTGGVCLDGSPPAYYYRPGKDLGLNRWVLHFNGGAWCFDEGACVERSKSSLGSTRHLPASPPIIEGINSPDPQVNPDFYDWNLVWIVYCDGASFTGNREEPVTVDGQLIYFRGKKILDVIFNDLIIKGMRHAERVILTGSSAGSMTAMFSIDYLATKLPNIPVHALSDAGFFIETAGMGGKSVGTIFKKIYEFQNSSSGLNQDCVRAFGPLHAWQCFLPEHTFKFIKQPVFILNAAYDVWALIYFVGINCKFPTPSSGKSKRAIDSIPNRETRDISNAMRTHDSKNRNEKGDFVLKHRDISGFEMLPFFRPSNEDKKTLPFYAQPIPLAIEAHNKENDSSIRISKDIQSNNLKKSEITSNKLKSKIESSKQEARNHDKKFKISGPTKRGFISEHTDIVDTLNSYSAASDDALEKLGNNAPIASMNEHPIIHNFPTSSTGTPVTPNPYNNDDLNVSEMKTEPVNGIPSSSPSDQKENSLLMSPLASSLSESPIDLSDLTQDDLKKEKLDPAALGLLAEVFGKLTRLLPTKKPSRNISVSNMAKNNTGGSDESTHQKVEPKVGNSNSLKLIKLNKNVHWPTANNLLKPKPTLRSPQTQKLVELQGKLKLKKMNSLFSGKLLPLRILNRTRPKLVHVNNLANTALSVVKPLHTPNINKAPLVLKQLHPNANMNKPLALAKHNSNQRNISLHRSNINTKVDRRLPSLAKEYINILRADPPECTDTQMVDIMKYRDAMMSATLSVQRKPNAGIFLVSCLDHSLSLFDETWTSVIVNGKTIAQAFGDWYYERPTKHYDVDCPYPCNQSCP